MKEFIELERADRAKVKKKIEDQNTLLVATSQQFVRLTTDQQKIKKRYEEDIKSKDDIIKKLKLQILKLENR